eukprot:CAMPEP_0117422148 /NCGR_PEP_ID=MMETSP0758-20121206/3048_1 /TAXON_ID=63605 /ORGANISM="Percolomonas cosmopolitus, Strain AE-1 (ATCC 50343)" /LENGTH=250 /DNA_ID=CAMNT_0005204599 /DNA_START=1965 /DNA_END=2713 /DNA_ORIENTATION=+
MQCIPHGIKFVDPDNFSVELCVEMRKAFVAKPGYVLLSADYSQIETRVLAHYAKDPGLINIVNSPTSDIFCDIAAAIWQVPPNQISKNQRKTAKSVVYGLFYGMGAHRLSRFLNTDLAEAKTLKKMFERAFPNVSVFREKLIRRVKKDYFVETFSRRRRLLLQINSKNPKESSSAARQAFNTIIQGSAADLIKKAMIQLVPYQERYGFYLISQIHDELLFEVPLKAIANVQPIVKHVMEHALPLSVPIRV